MEEQAPYSTNQQISNIDPKGLRIGNIVKYNGLYWKVSEILSPKLRKDKRFSDKYIVELFDGSGLISVPISEIYPATLTEEILLKTGFEKEWTDYNGFDRYFVLYYHEMSVSIYITVFEGTFWFAEEYDSTIWKTIPVNGIHSIQNRWYSLTGIELEIKL